MIGLVVTGHGHFADGLHTSARMIAGEHELARYVNFEAGMSTETPAETRTEVEVLAGTNLPMIVTAVTMIEYEEDPTALAEELLETGKEFMVRFALAAREEVEEDDGI